MIRRSNPRRQQWPGKDVLAAEPEAPAMDKIKPAKSEATAPLEEAKPAAETTGWTPYGHHF
jgi:hypothetical protein